MSTHNPQEADRLTREVESVDRAIDGLVYELPQGGWVRKK